MISHKKIPTDSGQIDKSQIVLRSVATLSCLALLAIAWTQAASAEAGQLKPSITPVQSGNISGPETGVVEVSMGTEAITLTQGEPLLLSYRVNNGMPNTIGFTYAASTGPVRLEVFRAADSTDSTNDISSTELVAKWPPAPKPTSPRALPTNGPWRFTFPRTQGCRLSPDTWFEPTLINPLQDPTGKPLAAGRYQVDVFVDLPIRVETAVIDEKTGEERAAEAPGETARAKFRIPLTVLPANRAALNRSAKLLRTLAASEPIITTKFYVDTLLRFPAETAYAACWSLIYDVQGDRQRSNRIIESLKEIETPQAVDLLALMAWRMKDEEAKRALAQLHSEKLTAGDVQGAERIAAWFTRNRASVLNQPQ